MFLVTRPEPKAQLCADALKRAGFQALARPALKIEATSVMNLMNESRLNTQRLAAYERIIVTSTYTETFLRKYLKRMLTHKTNIICVGESTAECVRKVLNQAHDISDDVSIGTARPPNSEGLIQDAMMQSIKGCRVALIKGKGGRDLIAQYVQQQEAELDIFEVYQRIPLYTSDMINSVEQASIQCIIVTSVDIAEQVLKHFHASWLKRCVFMVASERILHYLKGKGIKRLALANGASNDAIVTCAKQLFLSGVLDDRH